MILAVAGVHNPRYLGLAVPTFSLLPQMWFSEQAQSGDQVYRRSLPSGGYVAIATTEVRPLFAPPKIRGHIVVERRGTERREGHAPPIVAVAERDNVDSILEALVPFAESDEVLNETLQRKVTIPITQRRGLPN